MKLIQNARLWSMSNLHDEIVDIAFDGGKITEIGKLDASKFKPEDIYDAAGRITTPGIVDPHCHVGLFEDAIGFEGADGNEMTNPVTPELRAIDAVKPQDEAFKDALEAGITTVCTGPGSANVIGGTFCVMKTRGKTLADMVVVEESSMKMALGENPKRVYHSKNQTPSTRMASAALIREALLKARDYREKVQKFQSDQAEGKEVVKPEFNMKWASLSRVFDGFPVKIHAHQQDDIATAIRIIEEFGLNATIEHATEGYLIADYLKTHGTRVIIGPTLGSKSKYELRNKSFLAGKRLYEANIPFAIMTDHPVIPLENTLTQVGLFVKAGLPELAAMKAVTIEAAKMNGIDHLVGSIELGKHADIVVWNGHPLSYMTSPDLVVVEGTVAYSK